MTRPRTLTEADDEAGDEVEPPEAGDCRRTGRRPTSRPTGGSGRAADRRGPGGAVRLRLDLGYDGSQFHGWAAQPGLRTVQGVLCEALGLLLRLPSRLT